jgi:dTDP-4-dehydrorhamnose reductase
MQRQPARIVITGGRGRLGAVLCDELSAAGHAVFAFTRAELDITCAEQIETRLNPLQPTVIINCAAYNAVDAAETDRATAFAVNAHGPALLAAAAGAMDALFVHFSSDFVFDGTADRPYIETHPPNPLSAYGSSKLAGEVAASRAPRHYIVRVESLFGGAGNGHRATIDFITDAFLADVTVRVAMDRTVTPSYVPDVACATRTHIGSTIPYGIYHCVNRGSTTWYELAQEVARQLDIGGHIEPIRASELIAQAPRPKFCALSNQKLASAGITMPTWQSAVQRHLVGRKAEARIRQRVEA